VSPQRFRHFVMAFVCVLAVLIPAAPVQASSPSNGVSSAAAAAAPESAVLRKFRDSGPPVMERAAAYEAMAATHAFAAAPGVSARPSVAVSNPRLYREVFGFAFASSLGDATIGYPSWNFGLLSTVAYFGVHVSWTGDLSDDSGLSTWNNPNGPVPGVIQAAHAQGTKVVLTTLMMD